ncbi:cystatin-F [Triplophysa rosa]|nr:cystatin-F [Triplophysa rosa]
MFLQVFADLHAAKMMCILSLLAALCFVTGDRSTHNPNVVSVANFAIDFHNRMNNYPYAFKVVNIFSDSAQIYPPARVKYTLEVEAAQTVCRNQANVNLQDCPLQSDAETMICSFVVFAVPGNNTIPKRLLSDQCVSDGRGLF